jgi:hypothetical protein
VKARLAVFLAAVAAATFACDAEAAPPEAIYHNGPILTMNRAAPEA